MGATRHALATMHRRWLGVARDAKRSHGVSGFSIRAYRGGCTLLRVNRWALLWIVAACARPDRAARGRPAWPTSTTHRSTPSSFLGIAGLTQVTETTHGTNEWGFSDYSTTLVFRGSAAVCELPADAYTTAENHRGRRATETIELSREPLRFAVRETWESNDLTTLPTCTGYELTGTGPCRKLFEHSCGQQKCELHQKVSSSPGTGKIRGHVAVDQEPGLGVTIVVGSAVTLSDENGAFELDAGVGDHDVVVYEPNDSTPMHARVSVEPGRDVEVSLITECRTSELACCVP